MAEKDVRIEIGSMARDCKLGVIPHPDHHDLLVILINGGGELYVGEPADCLNFVRGFWACTIAHRARYRASQAKQRAKARFKR